MCKSRQTFPCLSPVHPFTGFSIGAELVAIWNHNDRIHFCVGWLWGCRFHTVMGGVQKSVHTAGLRLPPLQRPVSKAIGCPLGAWYFHHSLIDSSGLLFERICAEFFLSSWESGSLFFGAC